MSVAAASAPSGWRVWWLAIRPRTLPAALAPIVVGSAVAAAAGGFHILSAAAALTVALLLQITANLANDVFDFQRGADRVRFGPPRMTSSGFVSHQAMLRATGLAVAGAVVGGAYLVWRGGWPILALGLLAAGSAVAYTGGPFPLGYHGLGDLFAFIFFGPVGVMGSAFVQTRDWSWFAAVASLPIGCLIAAIIVVNNLRDLDTDRAAGKRTLAVRIGRAATIAEYRLLLTVAYLTPLVLWATGDLGGWWWLPWSTLPIALQLGRGVGIARERALNPLLGGTANLSLLFALAFAAAIVA